MSKVKTLSFALAALSLLLVGAARGGPLELKQVAAEAKWLGHVDFDAARSSPVVSRFMKECGKELPMLRWLSLICKQAGFDDCQKLHGLTIYGLEFGPHRGVVLVHADWNQQALAEKIQKAPDHKKIEYNGQPVHLWTMHKGTRYAHRAAATFPKPDLLVLGANLELVIGALDVLNDKAANLTAAKGEFAAKVPEGAIWLLRVKDVGDSRIAKRCGIFQAVETVNYDEGQRGSQWFGNLRVVAKSKTDAEDLKKILDGLTAAFALHFRDRPKLAEILRHMQVATDGNVTVVTFNESVDKLAAHMPEFCQEIGKQLRMHKRWMLQKQLDRRDGPGTPPCPMCPMMREAEGDK